MSAKTMPPNCRICSLPLRRPTDQRRPGFRVYAGLGRCSACARRLWRQGLAQRPSTRRVSVAELRSEVPHLRASGASDDEIAIRLGMSVLAFDRALYRAGLKGPKASGVVS